MHSREAEVVAALLVQSRMHCRCPWLCCACCCLHDVHGVHVQVRGEEPPGPDEARLRAPVRDELKLWETKAAAQFRLDGDDAGWDSDEPEEETQEEKYIKAWPSCWQHAYLHHQSLNMEWVI